MTPLLVSGTTIHSVGPFEQDVANIYSPFCVLPKNAIPGWEIVEADCSYSLDVSSHQWVDSAVVAKSPQLPSPEEFAKIIDYKLHEINDFWEAADNATFPYLGYTFDANAQSKDSINGVATQILLSGQFPVGFPGAWKCANNTFMPMQTVDTFKAFYAAMVAQGIKNFIHAQELKDAVAVITPATLAALETIHW
jgi:hypothetical protein